MPCGCSRSHLHTGGGSLRHADLVAVVLSVGISLFMGLAICLLVMLKTIDVQAFAASFHKYDLLSQRWRAWGRLYPGTELLVGAVDVWLEAMGMVSVGKAVLPKT